jgi:hypothetical protein
MRRVLVLAAACVLVAGAARAGDAVELRAKGVQIYSCTASGDNFNWKFKAPEAVLIDPLGQEAGKHFAGPSWQAKDGSVVVGEGLVSSSGEAGAVPWLVLRAKSHSGEGLFETVKYIVRSRTVGGVAPSSGCDKDHPNAEAKVDYTAIYTFFSAQDAKAQ